MTNKGAIETSEDCISRQAVIEHICESKECYKEECKGRTLRRCPDLQWVFDLPSVQPNALERVDSALERVGDAVSREAVENTINEWRDLHENHSQLHLYYLNERIRKLPSVLPQRKQGRWIKRDDIITASFCSECSNGWTWETAYCPNCGAEMSGGGEDDLKT